MQVPGIKYNSNILQACKEWSAGSSGNDTSVSFLFRHEGRTWYTSHRGRLWIAAASKAPTQQEIQNAEHLYRVLKGGEPAVFS